VDITPPSEMPSMAVVFEPAASRTARKSSIRCSSVGRGWTRSDIPQPRLSKRIRREKEARRSRKAAMGGQLPDVGEVRDPAQHQDEVDRTVADHLVGDVDVAVGRVPSARKHFDGASLGYLLAVILAERVGARPKPGFHDEVDAQRKLK
jgi:hypothetical protein